MVSKLLFVAVILFVTQHLFVLAVNNDVEKLKHLLSATFQAIASKNSTNSLNRERFHETLLSHVPWLVEMNTEPGRLKDAVLDSGVLPFLPEHQQYQVHHHLDQHTKGVGVFRNSFNAFVDSTKDYMNKWNSSSSSQDSNRMGRYIDGMLDSLEDQLRQVPLAASPRFQELLGASAKAVSNDVPTVFSEMIKELLSLYLNQIHPVMKARMIASFLSAPDSSESEAMYLFLSSGGPMLHKLMQYAGDKIEETEIRHIINRLKSSIAPMTQIELKQVLDLAFGVDGLNEHFNSFDMNPKAAASIAQGHFVELKSGQQVFCKVQRLEVRFLFENYELPILEMVGDKFPIAKGHLNVMMQSIYEELDLHQEFNNLRYGQRYYTNVRHGLAVPKRIGIFGERNKPSVLIMDRVEGVPLSKLEYLNMEEARALASKVTALQKLWLFEAMYGSGFYHGDLHAGNIMFTLNKENPKSSKLTIIDFGNAHFMTNEERYRAREMFFGLIQRSASRIIGSLIEKSSAIDENEKISLAVGEIRQTLDSFVLEHGSIFKLVVKRILRPRNEIVYQNSKDDPIISLIHACINKVVQAELQPSTAFTNFIRGRSLLEEVTSTLEKKYHLGTKYLMNQFNQSLQVGLRYGLFNEWKRLFVRSTA